MLLRSLGSVSLHSVSRVVVVGGLVLCAGVLPGCLISGSKSVHTTGDPVAEQSLVALEKGVSTEDDVLDLLGVPTRVVDLSDERKIYVYEWSEKRRRSTSVFLIFGGSSGTTTQGAANVEFRDGVVQRWWQDPA